MDIVRCNDQVVVHVDVAENLYNPLTRQSRHLILEWQIYARTLFSRGENNNNNTNGVDRAMYGRYVVVLAYSSHVRQNAGFIPVLGSSREIFKCHHKSARSTNDSTRRHRRN